MENVFRVAAVVAPILVTVYLGMLCRRKNLITPEGVQGLQQFVLNIALPCVVFNSILTAKVSAQSLAVMALMLPFVLGMTLWAFRSGKKKFPYRNLPMLFCARESGMLGIPLFMILFGSEQVYHMVILDLVQAIFFHPTVAILSSDTFDSPNAGEILKKVLKSPLVIMVLIALGLNLSGLGTLLQSSAGQVVTETMAFLGQPVSVLMIFCVGYNLSFSGSNRSDIFKLSLIHVFTFAVIAGLLQLLLFLLPDITALTRWAILLYCFLPTSYFAPILGKTGQEKTVASGVCSLTTAVTLVAFCIIAALTA